MPLEMSGASLAVLQSCRPRELPRRAMKIATFNVNGVNGRLPVLMRWLAETKRDIVCLQELKAPDDKFPEPAIGELGYRAVWHGQPCRNVRTARCNSGE